MSKKKCLQMTQKRGRSLKTSTLTISDNFSINQSHQGPFRPKKKKKKYLRFCHFQSLKIDFSIFSQIFQKLLRFSNSNASCQEVSLAHLTPKQLVSICHATIDLIRPQTNFHLSVPNPKYQNRHAYAQEMKNVQKKVSANDPKTWQEP